MTLAWIIILFFYKLFQVCIFKKKCKTNFVRKICVSVLWMKEMNLWMKVLYLLLWSELALNFYIEMKPKKFKMNGRENVNTFMISVGFFFQFFSTFWNFPFHFPFNFSLYWLNLILRKMHCISMTKSPNHFVYYLHDKIFKDKILLFYTLFWCHGFLSEN